MVRCLRSAVVLSIGLCALAAPGALALGISVPATSVGNLKPGTTSQSSQQNIVVSGLPTEGWSLRVDDPAGAATDGHMLRSNLCTLGVTSLASPLHLSFRGGLISTGIDRPEYDLDSLSNPVVAHGSTPDTFKVQFSQAVGASEALASGCGYSLTIRYTLSAG